MAKFEVVSDFKDKDVTLPKRGTGYSAGYDFYAVEDEVLPPNMTEPIIVPTGIKVELGTEEYLQIHIRSSLGIKHGIYLANTTGIIDSDYYNNEDNEGHIMVALMNRSNKGLQILKGDRLVQGIISEYQVVEGDNYGEGDTRAGGIGSTTEDKEN